MATRHSSRDGTVRVVLYLRMSSAKQDKSIPAQRDELTRQIEKRPNHRIVGEYVDSAISGDDTEKRLGFQNLRDDASKGIFDLIFAWDQDRFSRNDPLELGYWLKPIRDAGVKLETLSQGEIDWDSFSGRVVYMIQQEGKHAFLRDLSRNTTRGLLASAREGRAGTGGPSPFGYRSRDGKVWIIEDEARIVRLIFQLYLAPNGSLRGVAGELNRRGVKPPRGKVWRSSGVVAILQRRKYTGTFVMGERNSGKYFAIRDGEVIPRRKGDKNATAEPIVHENHFEAIVDQETFDNAQAKLGQNKRDTAPKTARQYLLTGLVRCGDCGGIMGGVGSHGRPVYKCRTYHQSGAAVCFCNTIPEGPLVSVVAKKIQGQCLSETALARLRKKIEAKLAAGDRPPSQRDLDRLRREIESLDEKIDRGADRVLEAPDDLLPTIYRKLQGLRSDRDRLKAELGALSTRHRQSGNRDGSEVDRVIGALRGLGEALQKASPTDTKQLLASIVSKIELQFTEGMERKKRDFTEGTIYVRPDAGGNRVAGPDSEVAQLSTIGWEYGVSEEPRGRPFLARASIASHSPPG